ncbi:MAG: endolytic transglycosylase MltG [Chitinophagales bacterium]|nr:endolytic transglycosylase MltG [Chitinophagales bacterium]
MGRIIRITLLSILVLGLAAGFYVYNKYVKGPAVPNGLSSYILTIPTNSDYETVIDSLQQNDFVSDIQMFNLFAERMNYIKNPMRAGRYELKPGWNMIELIRHLRGGKQAPVKLVLHNERLTEQVAAKAANFIEPDSLTIWQLFQDEAYLESIDYTPETLMSLFIPNTYEFFWNTSPKGFMERMIKEHDSFWSKNNRLAKAAALGMSQPEIYTLASIVEKETLVNTERTRMAGVYLNRLKIGMPLQADPTAVFATRDFDTPRVTHYHTKFDSPYNTYMYAGLPPGPISMASIGSIDAVLNVEKHDYLYFCAKGDGSGLHNFAKTLSQHNRNARIYKENLRKRGLR